MINGGVMLWPIRYDKGRLDKPTRDVLLTESLTGAAFVDALCAVGWRFCSPPQCCPFPYDGLGWQTIGWRWGN